MQKRLHWSHAERHGHALPRNVQAGFLKQYFKCLPCSALNKLYPHKATWLLLRSGFSWVSHVAWLSYRVRWEIQMQTSSRQQQGNVYDSHGTWAAHLLRKRCENTKVQNVYVILWSAVINLNQYWMRRTEGVCFCEGAVCVLYCMWVSF